MSLELLNREGNNAKLKLTIKREDFDKYINNAFEKNKGKINIPGFRKGKVPKAMVEKYYGEGFFYEDAINAAFSKEFYDEMEKIDLVPVATPTIDIEEIEKGKDVVIGVEVVVSPEIEIGKYRGLEIEYPKVEVTDEEVQHELEHKREHNARIVTIEDRAIKEGDIVHLDFEGKKDAVPFEGGKAENYKLEIGSKSFIDGFEDQLVGMKLGEEKTLDLTFPENYHEKSLAGAPVTFDVKINQIQEKELPELDDEFVKDISEFDTLDQLKESIRKELEDHKKEHADADFEDDIIREIVKDSKIDVPVEMIDTQTDMMYDEFAHSLMYQGLDINSYLNYIGKTEDELKAEMRPEAEKRIKSTLVLEKVKKLENISYSEDQVEEEFKKVADAYNMDVDKIKAMFGEKQKKGMIDNIIAKNTVEFLKGETIKK